MPPNIDNICVYTFLEGKYIQKLYKDIQKLFNLF